MIGFIESQFPDLVGERTYYGSRDSEGATVLFNSISKTGILSKRDLPGASNIEWWSVSKFAGAVRRLSRTKWKNAGVVLKGKRSEPVNPTIMTVEPGAEAAGVKRNRVSDKPCWTLFMDVSGEVGQAQVFDDILAYLEKASETFGKGKIRFANSEQYRKGGPEQMEKFTDMVKDLPYFSQRNSRDTLEFFSYISRQTAGREMVELGVFFTIRIIFIKNRMNGKEKCVYDNLVEMFNDFDLRSGTGEADGKYNITFDILEGAVRRANENLPEENDPTYLSYEFNRTVLNWIVGQAGRREAKTSDLARTAFSNGTRTVGSFLRDSTGFGWILAEYLVPLLLLAGVRKVDGREILTELGERDRIELVKFPDDPSNRLFDYEFYTTAVDNRKKQYRISAKYEGGHKAGLIQVLAGKAGNIVSPRDLEKAAAEGGTLKKVCDVIDPTASNKDNFMNIYSAVVGGKPSKIEKEEETAVTNRLNGDETFKEAITDLLLKRRDTSDRNASGRFTGTRTSSQFVQIRLRKNLTVEVLQGKRENEAEKPQVRFFPDKTMYIAFQISQASK